MSDSGQDKLSPGQMAQLLAVGAGTDSDGEAATPPPDEPCADELLDDEAPPLTPGDTVDDFEILSEIGRGGMCFVFQAHDTRLDRRVALKVLRPSLARTPSIARRFYRESILAGGLSHPAAVPVYSQGHCDDGTPYFVMEYVQGRDLARTIADRGPMAPDAVAAMGQACCDALDHAHRKGIVHRDVTPRNVLLTRDAHRVRLVDFGVAQDTTGRWTQTTQAGASVGTVAFMSPEQNLGQELDARTDVFSLGLVLYFALTGRRAYQADNRAELALAFQIQSPQPPSDVCPNVPAELSGIIMRMIEVDLDRRYQSCESAGADFSALRAGRLELLSNLRTDPSPAAAVTVPATATPVSTTAPRRAPALTRAVGMVLGATALALGAWHFGAGTAANRRDSDADQPAVTARAELGAVPEAAPEAPAGGEPESDEAGANSPAQPPEPAETPDAGANAPATGPPAGKSKPAPEPPAEPKQQEPHAESLRAVVLWIYQPDSKKDFEDEGILLGQTTLKKDADSLGFYGFDPATGLKELKSPVATDVDFRVAEKDGRLMLISDAAGADQAARISHVRDPDHPADDVLDKLHSASRYVLKPSSTLFVVCAKGGHAMLRVERVVKP